MLMFCMPFSLAASESQLAGAETCVPPPQCSSLGLPAQNCFLQADVPSRSLAEQSGFGVSGPVATAVHFCEATAAAAFAPPLSLASVRSLSISAHLLLCFSESALSR